MKLSIKSKLYVGLGLMAGLMVLLWLSGAFFINTLADNSGAIIQDNIRTVTYAQQMEKAINELYTMQLSALGNGGSMDRETYNIVQKKFEQALSLQQKNITETGEQELTDQLQSNYEHMLALYNSLTTKEDRSADVISSRFAPSYHRLQQNLVQLTNMNVDAIHRKNHKAQQTANQVTLYMSIIGALCSMLGLVMLVRFPGYIVEPVRELIQRMKNIADYNYDQTLDYKTGDEYEELAAAFNQMARRLQEYDRSSLNKIMSEKKRLETIINHMTDAVIGMDADKQILFANDKAIELLEQPKEELVEQYVPDVASQNELFYRVMHAISEGDKSETEYLKIGKEPEHYYAVETIPVRQKIPETSYESAHLGFIITLKNVTRFQEQAQAKTDFISLVSHELKTPIASIGMSLRLLNDQRVGPLNEEQEKLLGNIKGDVNRMKQTTTELLDLTKIETGNVQINLAPVSPIDLLNYAYETMQMQAEQKGLNINISVSRDLPLVQADTQKTLWVLINLISNAIRYTDTGGMIQLQAQEDDDSNFIRFSVTDSGKGINPNYLDKIFEKFFRIDKDQTDQSGSGLGLSIAKEFILAQGGRIWAESNFGEGSSFYFVLQRA